MLLVLAFPAAAHWAAAGRGRPRTGRIAVNITLPEMVRDELERVAEEEQTPMSEIIERLLRRYFMTRRTKDTETS
jgi:hypothetical protein